MATDEEAWHDLTDAITRHLARDDLIRGWEAARRTCLGVARAPLRAAAHRSRSASDALSGTPAHYRTCIAHYRACIARLFGELQAAGESDFDGLLREAADSRRLADGEGEGAAAAIAVASPLSNEQIATLERVRAHRYHGTYKGVAAERDLRRAIVAANGVRSALARLDSSRTLSTAAHAEATEVYVCAVDVLLAEAARAGELDMDGLLRQAVQILDAQASSRKHLQVDPTPATPHTAVPVAPTTRRGELPLRARHIFLTGEPGVGKTCLACAAVNEVASACGFYTEERRAPRGERVGFDAVALSGSRGPLASRGSGEGPRVGRYTVDVASFEAIALPSLERASGSSITLIDEVGKMELFSQRFLPCVTSILDAPDTTVLGTLPMLRSGQALVAVETIRARADVAVVHVSRSNRDAAAVAVRAIITSAAALSQPGESLDVTGLCDFLLDGQVEKLRLVTDAAASETAVIHVAQSARPLAPSEKQPLSASTTHATTTLAPQIPPPLPQMAATAGPDAAPAPDNDSPTCGPAPCRQQTTRPSPR